MSIEIHIHVPVDAVATDKAGSYLESAMSALGFARAWPAGEPVVFATLESGEQKIEPLEAARGSTAEDAVAAAEESPLSAKNYAGEVAQGEPAPAPRKRRTKAEIEAEKAAAQDPKQVVQQLEQAAVAEQRAISTTPEDRQQDEADEKAESQTETFTVDTIRDLAGKYVAKFGMAAVQEDGRKILEKALGPVPDGMTDSDGKPVPFWRLSVLPTDQPSLTKMVHAWEKAIETNPFDRAAVA